ncbi:hypothetical protein AN161_00815 [Lysinibacillus sp. FJAT-14222]|nr:hypothetical protein AN161_00815 [Lysinibacillus sp. FJAT-14222]
MLLLLRFRRRAKLPTGKARQTRPCKERMFSVRKQSGSNNNKAEEAARRSPAAEISVFELIKMVN